MPLNLPDGVTLEQILGTHTGDEPPIADLAVFDTLASTADKATIARLVSWVEPQSVCGDIIRHHGYEALARVLQGIARAASARNVHMGHRVGGVAGSLGLVRL